MLQTKIQNERGNAFIGLIIGVGIIVAIWFIFSSVLGIIGSNFDEKRKTNEENQKARRTPKTVKAVDRHVSGKVVNY